MENSKYKSTDYHDFEEDLIHWLITYESLIVNSYWQQQH